jgi:very-short-patch-repair endonuclease
LPAPTSQWSFTHPRRGWIGYLDFAWPAARAALECDGYQYHSSREAFQTDRRRWTAVGTAGWHLAVVTWFDVMYDPDYVVEVVQELLGIDGPDLLNTIAA